jgi:hypothetical protein
VPSEYCTLEDVAARMRVDLAAVPPDPDADWLEACWLATCEAIDSYYGAAHPLVAPYPASVNIAAIGATCAAFRGKDAMSDVSEEWVEGLAPRVPRDPLSGWYRWLGAARHGSEWAPA